MTENNYIIGINWEQNSTACLFKNGQLVGSLSEERISRVKNDERYPKAAIDFLIKEHSVSVKEIEAICFISKVWAPGHILARHYTNFSIQEYIKEQKELWYPKLIEGVENISMLSVFQSKLDLKQFPGEKFWKKIVKSLEGTSAHPSDKSMEDLGKKIRSDVVKLHLDIPEEKIHFLDHSFGHAAYAYYSCKDQSKSKLVITLDAFGDHVNYSAHVFERNNKGDVSNKLVVKGDDFIIGRLFRYTTLLLGLKPNEHEYKVMGLAPYCKKKYFKDLLNELHNIQKVDGLNFVYTNKPNDMYFSFKDLYEGERFDTIAGALQGYTEDLISSWVNNLVKETGIKDICFAGGVAMNVKSNMVLSKLKNVNSLHIPPSPDDSSQAMGAVYSYLHNQNVSQDKKNQSIGKLESAYLGCMPVGQADVSAIESDLKDSGFKIENADISLKAAKILANNLVIGRISGREEFGARALGNRSILANPGNVDIKIKINEKIKDRDFWMPFACSILESKASEYLELDVPASSYSFMTNCCFSSKKGKDLIPAALHPYDQTCRPHIVIEGSNNGYEQLIKDFSSLTGTSAILNTSLNLHGLPIASSLKDAVHVFIESDLDAIITDTFLAIKPDVSSEIFSK